MKVKLAPGRRLRDPITKVLMEPDTEREVPLNQYWTRRLRDGDVVEVAERRQHRAAETKEV
jgi:hypothetical protein